MITLAHLGLGLLLVVLQTTLLQPLTVSGYCYDLLIPFVIHLGRNYSPRYCLPLVIGFGLLSDSLSAATFGIYTTTYGWLLILIYWLLTFLQARSSLVWPFIVALGIALEHLVILTVTGLIANQPIGWSHVGPIMVRQFILALITGPLVLSVLAWSWRYVARRQRQHKRARSEAA